MHQPIFFRCRRIGLPIVCGITLLFFSSNAPIAFAQSSCDCTLEIEGNGPHLLSDLIEKEILPDPSSLFGFGGPCLKINGTLEIDIDYAFYGSGPNEKTEIIMAPCSQIEVKAGVFFSMDYVFMHGCETMWKGITLERGELSGGVQGAGAQIQFNYNDIRDAQYAVSAGHYSTINLIGNQFINNYVGFRVLAYEDSPWPLSYVKFQNPLEPDNFRNNDFIFDAEEDYLEYCDLSDPVTDLSYAGIEFNRATTFFIGEEDVSPADVTNYFTGMRYGVCVNGSTAIGLRGLIIENLNDTGDDATPVGQQTSTGIRIVKSKDVQVEYADISDCRNGIVISLSGLKNGFRENDISVDNNAVYALNNGGELAIENNALTAANGVYISTMNGETDVNGNAPVNFSNFGIYAFNIKGPYDIRNNTLHSVADVLKVGAEGIHVQNATFTSGRIYNNTVDLASSSFQAEAGIRLINCNRGRVFDNSALGEDGPSNNYFMLFGLHGVNLDRMTFCCNNVDKTNQGFSFQSVNTNVKYFTTTFGDHQYGLSFFPGATINAQVNTGNDWSGADCYFYEARYPGIQIVAQANAPFTASSALAPSPTSPSGWFTIGGSDPECGESPFVCDAGNPEAPSDHPTDVTADDLKALESATGLLEIQQRFEQQRYLYAKLKAHPSLVSWSTPVTNFYNAAAAGFIGDLYEVNKQYAELFDLPEPLADDYADQLDNMQTALDVLHEKYTEYLTETNPTKKAAALADFYALVEEVSDYGIALETMELDVADELNDRLDDLLIANAALSPSELIEANQQSINELLFQAVAQPDLAFNLTDQETIDDMAAQCPDYDGTAVYKARHLQTLYSFNNAYDDVNCTAAPREAAQPMATVASGMIVYPNPAVDFTTVQFAMPLASEGRLSLVDWSGRIVRESRLPAHTAFTTFQWQGLPPGVYYLQAYAAEKMLATTNLAILR